MKTHSFYTLLIAILFIAFISCRSESLHTNETVQASMSGVESDRVYYIERATDKFAGDLVLHLSFGEEANPLPQKFPLPTIEVKNDEHVPTHIGPFCIKHARPIKQEAWDLEKLILEWIFDVEE